MGDRLVDLLLTGLDEGNPGASEYCVVYLVSRSGSDPDVVHITEGWTSEEDHHRIFAGEAAQAIVAQLDGLQAKEAEYTDFVPVHGKAAFRDCSGSPGTLPNWASIPPGSSSPAPARAAAWPPASPCWPATSAPRRSPRRC
jgi:hypothetical protein